LRSKSLKKLFDTLREERNYLKVGGERAINTLYSAQLVREDNIAEVKAFIYTMMNSRMHYSDKDKHPLSLEEMFEMFCEDAEALREIPGLDGVPESVRDAVCNLRFMRKLLKSYGYEYFARDDNEWKAGFGTIRRMVSLVSRIVSQKDEVGKLFSDEGFLYGIAKEFKYGFGAVQTFSVLGERVRRDKLNPAILNDDMLRMITVRDGLLRRVLRRVTFRKAKGDGEVLDRLWLSLALMMKGGILQPENVPHLRRLLKGGKEMVPVIQELWGKKLITEDNLAEVSTFVEKLKKAGPIAINMIIRFLAEQRLITTDNLQEVGDFLDKMITRSENDVDVADVLMRFLDFVKDSDTWPFAVRENIVDFRFFNTVVNQLEHKRLSEEQWDRFFRLFEHLGNKISIHEEADDRQIMDTLFTPDFFRAVCEGSVPLERFKELAECLRTLLTRDIITAQNCQEIRAILVGLSSSTRSFHPESWRMITTLIDEGLIHKGNIHEIPHLVSGLAPKRSIIRSLKTALPRVSIIVGAVLVFSLFASGIFHQVVANLSFFNNNTIFIAVGTVGCVFTITVMLTNIVNVARRFYNDVRQKPALFTTYLSLWRPFVMKQVALLLYGGYVCRTVYRICRGEGLFSISSPIGLIVLGVIVVAFNVGLLLYFIYKSYKECRKLIKVDMVVAKVHAPEPLLTDPSEGLIRVQKAAIKRGFQFSDFPLDMFLYTITHESTKDLYITELLYALEAFIRDDQLLESDNWGLLVEEFLCGFLIHVHHRGKMRASELTYENFIQRFRDENVYLHRALLEDYCTHVGDISQEEAWFEHITEDMKQLFERFDIVLHFTEAVDLNERDSLVLYNVLRKHFPESMRGVRYDRFFESEASRKIFAALQGKPEEFYLSSDDVKKLIDLTLDLHEEIERYIRTHHDGDDLWIISFRDLMRLHQEFINRYLGSDEALRDGTINPRDVLSNFVMTAMTVYGDMFGSEWKEFKTILSNVFHQKESGDSGYLDLFVKLSLFENAEMFLSSVMGGETPEKERSFGAMIDRLRFKSFDTLHRKEEESFLWGSESLREAYYSMRRAVELGYPTLQVLSPLSGKVFDEALVRLARDMGGKVHRFPLSNYTEREDLMGMRIPANGTMDFEGGILPKLIEEAYADPDKPVYAVFDNIDAAQSDLLVTFNSILWERVLPVPELGELLIPPNLHFMFTMDQNSRLHDEALTNRVIRQRRSDLERNDFITLLTKRYDLDKGLAQELVSLYESLNKEQWKHGDVRFSPQDFLNIMTHVRTRMAAGSPDYDEHDMFAEEAYRYFSLRFRYYKDRLKFESVFESVFGTVDNKWKKSTITLKTKLVSSFDKETLPEPLQTYIRKRGCDSIAVIEADGIEIPLGVALQDYVLDEGITDFKQLLREKLHYSLRETDRKLLAQCTRGVHPSRDGPYSLVTVLEGISGEGKTQLAEILGPIIGYDHIGFTAHKTTQLDQIRGGLSPEGEKMKLVTDTPALRALRNGRHVINVSEGNTTEEQALLYWLYPEISGADEHILSEIPSNDPRYQPFYTNPIAKNNFVFLDLNPDDYRAREKFPPILQAQTKNFWMGYDYTEENPAYQQEVADELEELISDLLELHFPELKRYKERYIKLLADIYYTIQKDLAAGTMHSQYQVLTMRDIIRVIKLFRHYEMTKGDIKDKPPRELFKKALKNVFWGMWVEDEAKDGVERILKGRQQWIDEYDPAEVMKDVLTADAQLGHVLINSDPLTDGYELAREVIGTVNPDKGDIHYMNVSEFMELDSFVGGVALDEEGKLDVYAGILLKLIDHALEHPERQQYLVLDGFDHINADTAVGLNKLLQDGKIALPPQLIDKFKGTLVDGMYAELPSNIKVVAVSYAHSSPNKEDVLPMSGAELSRLFAICPSKKMTSQTLQQYLQMKLVEEGITEAGQTDVIIRQAQLILRMYERQQHQHLWYSHSRLSTNDLDEYLRELVLSKDQLDAGRIRTIAFHTLGMGLRDKYQKELLDTIEADDLDVRYFERDDKVYLEINGVEKETKFASIDDVYTVAVDKQDVIAAVWSQILKAGCIDQSGVLSDTFIKDIGTEHKELRSKVGALAYDLLEEFYNKQQQVVTTAGEAITVEKNVFLEAFWVALQDQGCCDNDGVLDRAMRERFDADGASVLAELGSNVYRIVCKAHKQKYLAPIDEVLHVYDAVLRGARSGRNLFLLEGKPGVGKTALGENFAKMLGYPPHRFRKSSMYNDIELWEFLGEMEKIGPNEYRLTATKEEMESEDFQTRLRYVSDFLDFVKNGGVYLFDEVNLSDSSLEAFWVALPVQR